MSIKISKNQSLRMVDRTLPEIFNGAAGASRPDIIRFCRMLKELGFDFIEINTGILQELKKLPPGMNFLLRVEKIEDVRVCIDHNIRYCCLDEMSSFDLDLLSLLYDSGIDIMVEIQLDRMKDYKSLMSLECKSSFVKAVRIIGLNRMEDIAWAARFINSAGESWRLPLNICPENQFSSASAMAVQAVKKGFEALTTVFAGGGPEKAYASAEEVLAAVQALISPEYKMDFSRLYEAEKCFTHISGTANKPVSDKMSGDESLKDSVQWKEKMMNPEECVKLAT